MGKEFSVCRCIIQLITSMLNGNPAPEGYAVIHVDADKPKKLPLE